MLKFSFFKAPITNTTPFVDYGIKTAIEMIRSDKYRADIERLRNSDNDSIKNVIKKNLDYFCFSGTFKKRNIESLIKHSGIICLDFDGLTDEKLEEVTAQLKETDIVLAFFISPSGSGIKVLVKINGKKHLESFHSLKQFFDDNFELAADKGVNDFTRACYVSWDPNAYLNEDSKPWKVPADFKSEDTGEKIVKDDDPKPIPASKQFEINASLQRVQYCIDQIEREQIDITDNDYEDRMLVGFALSTLGEEARELYHRAVQYNDAYTRSDADYKFTDALRKSRFKTPAKFFKLCDNHGISTKKVRTIDEAKKKKEVENIIGDEQGTEDWLKYGIWVQNDVYWALDLKDKRVQVSNFKMRVLFHVATSDDEAYRLIQIKNIFGLDTVIKINTDDFVSAGTFKKVVARKGNFLWFGQEYHLAKLQDMLQREEKPTQLVQTLGFNKRGNFYAWANGIYDADINEFIKVDEYGIVEHTYKGNPQNYFIPAMSKIFADKDDMYTNDKKFLLQQSDTTFQEWTTLFENVYGMNGRVGIVYYVAALFSDIIFKTIGQRFPILFPYGKRGSGKGSMIQSIMRMFGEGQDQIMLGGASTVVGFMRKLAQYSNSIVWMDEYKNNLNPKVIESIKNIFDRIGYERGRKDNTFQTESTPIRSAVILSGQEMPTIEPALFTRVMQICFSETKRTEAARARYRNLTAMQDKGLSHLTVELLQFRGLFKEHFGSTYEAALREFSESINNNEVDERMLGNYAVLIATMELISQHEKLPFTVDDFKAQCKKLLMEQFHVLKGSDDASKFWQIVEQLVSTGEIWEDKHYQLKNGFIDIRIQDIYQKYAETMQKRRDPNILDKSTLDSYLMSDAKTFVKRHKPFFGGAQKWCLQFTYIELGIDIISASDRETLKMKYRDMGLPTDDAELKEEGFPEKVEPVIENAENKTPEEIQSEIDFPFGKTEFDK